MAGGQGRALGSGSTPGDPLVTFSWQSPPWRAPAGWWGLFFCRILGYDGRKTGEWYLYGRVICILEQ